jgi:transcription elongation GreA/GreB family factor
MGTNVTLANKAQTDRRLLLLHERDNVLVVTENIAAGETILVAGVTVGVPKDLPLGHKVARALIAPAAKIVKYAVPIGSAITDIAVGEHVHVHNIRSDYTPTYHLTDAKARHPVAQSSESL